MIDKITELEIVAEAFNIMTGPCKDEERRDLYDEWYRENGACVQAMILAFKTSGSGVWARSASEGLPVSLWGKLKSLVLRWAEKYARRCERGRCL